MSGFSDIPLIPRKRESRALYELVSQIAPAWILTFDQLELPGTIPFLELSFALEGRFAGLVQFVPNEYLHTILFGKASNSSSLVLPNTAGEIISHSDVQGAIPTACQDVYKEAHRALPGFPLARE
jgi:hypothetical protein